MKKNTKKEIYFRCIHCKDEIFWNTQKRMTYCKCGKIAIDGCEDYVRIIGDEKDCKEIKK